MKQAICDNCRWYTKTITAITTPCCGNEMHVEELETGFCQIDGIDRDPCQGCPKCEFEPEATNPVWEVVMYEGSHGDPVVRMMVPGGWLVVTAGVPTFVPDLRHEWEVKND